MPYGNPSSLARQIRNCCRLTSRFTCHYRFVSAVGTGLGIFERRTVGLVAVRRARIPRLVGGDADGGLAQLAHRITASFGCVPILLEAARRYAAALAGYAVSVPRRCVRHGPSAVVAFGCGTYRDQYHLPSSECGGMGIVGYGIPSFRRRCGIANGAGDVAAVRPDSGAVRSECRGNVAGVVLDGTVSCHTVPQCLSHLMYRPSANERPPFVGGGEMYPCLAAVVVRCADFSVFLGFGAVSDDTRRHCIYRDQYSGIIGKPCCSAKCNARCRWAYARLAQVVRSPCAGKAYQAQRSSSLGCHSCCPSNSS